MTPDEYLDLLARLQDAFADLTGRTDRDAPVPGLGDWPAGELVLHLAGVHHWAAGMAVGDTTRGDDLPDGPPPLDASALEALYRGEALALRTTLAAAGPDGPAVTFSGPGTASFWFRRQVHETLVHLGDLAAARSGAWTPDVLDAVVPVSAATWADGVDEVVTVFEPRQVRLGRIVPLPVTAALHAHDTGQTWVLGAHEDGRDPAERPAVTATASARDLDLLLWGRISTAAAGVVVDGDLAVLETVLGAGIVP